MSELKIKRQLPPKVVKMQARKRQKMSTDHVTSQLSQGTKAPEIVRIENLAWREISPSGQLDNYEGFFGLEEIDDVDVVRDADSGKVSYKLAGSAQKLGKNVALPIEQQDDSEEGSVQGEEEWTGIDDEVQPSINRDVQPLPKSRKEKKPATENGVKYTKDNCKRKVERHLPTTNGAFSVLDSETVEDSADVSAWKQLDLSPDMLESLSILGFGQPTSIQSSAIPDIIQGHDLIGKAPTGSGKTLAFGIPIIEYWLTHRKPSTTKSLSESAVPTALIILPTRELAHQIATHLKALCSHSRLTDLSIATLTGGLSIHKQTRVLSRADVVVATPGRLWELVTEGKGVLESLKGIKFLVVDEADRLLSEGHFKELEEVLTALDREVDGNTTNETELSQQAQRVARQTLVFSATLSKSLQQRLAKRTYQTSSATATQISMEYLLRKLNFREPRPRFVDVNPVSQMPSTLQERILECPGTEKDLHAYTLLLLQPRSRALVFVNSIAAVRRIVPFLTNLNLTAYGLHSQMPQKARLRSVERFTEANTANGVVVLVATDVAARGLDIANVHLVVHYHVPRTANTYVHRSGRTARGEKSGASVLICAPEEAAGVRRLVALVHAADKTQSGSMKHFIRTVDLDNRVVTRLKPRAVLAKKLADADSAKEKGRAEENWMKAAAEELGVAADDVEEDGGAKRGRGKKRREMEAIAKQMTKAEMRSIRAELKSLLAQRVNVGVSEKYLTRGGVDVDALLRGESSGFLGNVDSLGLRLGLI